MAREDPPHIERNTINNTIVQLKGKLLTQETVSSQQNVEQVAGAVLRAWRRELLISDPDREFSLISLDRDQLGYTHLRYAQHYRGIPVWKAALSIHFNPQQQPYLLSGAYFPTPEGLDTASGIGKEEALRSVTNLNSAVNVADYTARRVIFFQAERQPLLAWEIEPQGRAALRSATYIIDAQTGGLLLRQPARLPLGKHL